MKLRAPLLFSILLLALSMHAQDNRRPYPNVNIAVGNTHRSADSLRVSGFNLGLVSTTDSLRGFQLGALTGVALRHAEGVNMGGLFALTVGNMRGFQFSGTVNAVGGTANGVMLTPIMNLSHSFRGAQVGVFGNATGEGTHGVQLSAITNIAPCFNHGLQLSALVNISSQSMRGVQIGGYNYADTLTGLQVGLLNAALNHTKGWQIGIINCSRTSSAHKIGLVNVDPNTDIDFMAFAGTSSKLNFAARFRNRRSYSIIGVGTHYMGFDEDFSGTFFYRWGKFHSFSHKFAMGSDLGFFHIETFEKNSQTKPERLYSLQWRLNAEWQVKKNIGVFASAGFGTTRYYGSNHNYRTRPLLEVGVSWRYHRDVQSLGRRSDAFYQQIDTDSIIRPLGLFAWENSHQHHKSYWYPVLGVTGINVFVHCFDRFVTHMDCANVYWKSIGHNFRHAFVWDNDQFSTNLFAHPFHGNLYFNMARSYGLDFWHSIPYALGGSLMWEFCGENEPPAINDVMATSIGGTAIGEVFHRLSELMLNDRTVGFNRFLREFGSTVVNPMGGLRRIMTGDAWRVRDKYYLYHDYRAIPIDFSVSTGLRYIADDGRFFQGAVTPYINLFLEYGDPLSEVARKPYDFFNFEITFGAGGHQPMLNQLHLLGHLWSTPIYVGDEVVAEFGFFQHFNYYDSEPIKHGTSLTPYRISEAASVGPGFIFRFPKRIGVLDKFEQRLFISGILLGGTKSDYYNVIDRDYNMGSGFSVKTKTFMNFRHFGRFILKTDYYRIFTWKGYEGKDLEHIDPLYLNAQGDKGNATLFVVTPQWEFDFRGPLSLTFAGSYFMRYTYYSYHQNVHAQTFDFHLGLTYHF